MDYLGTHNDTSKYYNKIIKYFMMSFRNTSCSFHKQLLPNNIHHRSKETKHDDDDDDDHNKVERTLLSSSEVLVKKSNQLLITSLLDKL
jgi:hypothetical protein